MHNHDGIFCSLFFLFYFCLTHAFHSCFNYRLINSLRISVGLFSFLHVSIFTQLEKVAGQTPCTCNNSLWVEDLGRVKRHILFIVMIPGRLLCSIVHFMYWSVCAQYSLSWILVYFLHSHMWDASKHKQPIYLLPVHLMFLNLHLK